MTMGDRGKSQVRGTSGILVIHEPQKYSKDFEEPSLLNPGSVGAMEMVRVLTHTSVFN